MEVSVGWCWAEGVEEVEKQGPGGFSIDLLSFNGESASVTELDTEEGPR